MSVKDSNSNTTPASSRLAQLPTYVFAQLDDMKDAARARGADLIDLGMGNPDTPTPSPIVKAIGEAILKPENHRYPHFKGKPEFRAAVARWMKRRYDVSVNPDTDVLPLLGSKEGLAHLAFAYSEENKYSIIPCPYYPVHARATWLAGGKVHLLPLTEANDFLPDIESIPDEVAQNARLFFVSYPHNPTTAVAPRELFEKLVAFCRRWNIVLVNDLAYGEICFDGFQAPSIFNIPGAKEVAIEFHSFSKSFSMAGWRAGFAVGNPDIIKNLYSLKTNLDYGLSPSIQDGAIYALDHAEEFLPAIAKTYQERRDIVVKGFRELGWASLKVPQASMYVWLRVPAGFESSMAWCQHVMDTADVVVSPGHAFGEYGQGYFRVSLVSSKEILLKALDRLRNKGIRFDSPSQ